MMKKLLLLVTALTFLFCSVTSASEFQPTKKVVLFYRVSDAILQSQNDAEDIAKGQEEFEKELLKHYSKRFLVQDVKRNTYQPTFNPTFYQDLIKPNQVPLMVQIELAGETTTSTNYQNAYGAQATGYAPAINVHLIEALPRANSKEFVNVDYGIKTYSSGTFALGMNIYAAQTDPRKNVKNSVRASFRDACKLNEQINKFVDPMGAEIEMARFSGNFEKMEELQAQKYAPALAEIERFTAWCNADETKKSFLQGLGMLSTIEQKLAYINQLKSMGYYK